MFGMKKNTKINKRLRKYRADKIQKESSFKKNEGITLPIANLMSL